MEGLSSSAYKHYMGLRVVKSLSQPEVLMVTKMLNVSRVFF